MEQQTTVSPIVRYRSWLCIGLPTLCVLLYLAFWAKPGYESKAHIVVQTSEKSPVLSLPGMGGRVMGGGSPKSLEDAYIVIEYLKSPELIEALDAEYGLKAHYSSPVTDVFRKLPSDANADELVEYFRRQLHLKVASDSGIISMSLKAFDPGLAQSVLQEMIERGEATINQLNDRIREAGTDGARRRLEKTKEDLRAVRKKLFAFQVDRKVIRPETEIEKLLTNLAELDGRILQKKAELKTKEQFLKRDVFELKSLRQEIRGLEQQREEKASSLFVEREESLADSAHKFETLKLESEFALQAYTAALASYEEAKLEALRKEKFLLTVSAPTKPVKATYPKPLTGALLALIVLSLVYGIGRLVVATVLDHTV